MDCGAQKVLSRAHAKAVGLLHLQPDGSPSLHHRLRCFQSFRLDEQFCDLCEVGMGCGIFPLLALNEGKTGSSFRETRQVFSHEQSPTAFRNQKLFSQTSEHELTRGPYFPELRQFDSLGIQFRDVGRRRYLEKSSITV
jgi:hypothetical protein